jgi:hypothetical protein
MSGRSIRFFRGVHFDLFFFRGTFICTDPIKQERLGIDQEQVCKGQQRRRSPEIATLDSSPEETGSRPIAAGPSQPSFH